MLEVTMRRSEAEVHSDMNKNKAMTLGGKVHLYLKGTGF
jgi:hypothetical protein